jgi:hypothetical protein
VPVCIIECVLVGRVTGRVLVGHVTGRVLVVLSAGILKD